jgi:hypothetical protein
MDSEMAVDRLFKFLRNTQHANEMINCIFFFCILSYSNADFVWEKKKKQTNKQTSNLLTKHIYVEP